MKQTALKNLLAADIEAKPRDFDFGAGYGEKWEFHEASECQECGKVLTSVNGEMVHNEVDEDSNCEGYVNAEGPMMNYLYPFDHRYEFDIQDAMRAIVHLPLCLVSLEDEDGYYLALTGGGMDLSWEICEAYMRLGHLPPVHFCDLPRMSGRGKSKHDRWIIAGCVRSCQVASRWAHQKTKRLRELRAG